jgi:hypothetical protein
LISALVAVTNQNFPNRFSEETYFFSVEKNENKHWVAKFWNQHKNAQSVAGCVSGFSRARGSNPLRPHFQCA